MRLFVAVWPPPELVDRFAALPRPTIIGLRWTNQEQWHVTLRFLGWVEDPAPVIDALRSVEARACVAAVGPAVARFGQRILHVPVDGLAEVAAAVVDTTRHLGEPPEDRAFSGHLTLARVGKGAKVDLRRLVGAPIEGEWPVNELTLVQSRLSPAGARYEVVDRFPLVS